jgi:excisionase family DNA binding protein
MSDEDYLNTTEAAAYLTVSKQRIHTLAQQGRLGRKIAGHFVFTRQELDEYRVQPKSKGGRPKQISLPQPTTLDLETDADSDEVLPLDAT